MKSGIGLCSLIMLASTPVRADDWPVWGGRADRNMVNTVEKNMPSEWDIATGKNIKWSAKLGSQSYGNAVVSGGKVFIGTNNEAARQPKSRGDKGVIMCFAEKDGKFLWQATHDKLESGRVNDWPQQGICSSPHVEGDRLYYVSNRCELICADSEGFTDGQNDGPFDKETLTDPIDADIIWKLDMIGEFRVFPHNLATCSPLVAGNIILIVTGNGVDEGHIVIPEPQAPSFLAVDKTTGKALWKSNLPDGHIMHGQWSNATYGVIGGTPQAIFPGGDGFLYSFAPETGEMLWKFNCNPPDAYFETGGEGTKNNIIGTPVVYKDRVYLAVGEDPEHGEGIGHMWCVDGTKRGDITQSGLVWHNGEVKRALATCAIKDGIVYHSDLSGFFRAIDAETGKTLWMHDLLAAVWGSPMIVDGKVMIGDEDGDVVVFKEGREKTVLAEHNMGNSVYTTPVAANGTLFISNRSRLFAIEEGAKSEPVKD